MDSLDTDGYLLVPSLLDAAQRARLCCALAALR